MFTTIIILIVTLIVLAILINAIQQHKERVEAERRAEIAKQKAIIDETETVLATATQVPISPRLAYVLHKRILDALKVIAEIASTPDVRQRISDVTERVEAIDHDSSEVNENINLPDNDKQIIYCIQGLKKLRVLLRAEHSKGKVDTRVFTEEDKRLDKMQLRVNVDTLARRAETAMKTQMMGSARQYLEKAIAALTNFPANDDYITEKKKALSERLSEIQENLRNSNAKDTARRIEEEKDDLDLLFAPKKKW